MEGRRRGRQLDQGLQPPHKVLVSFWPVGLWCMTSWGGRSFGGWGLRLKADKGFAMSTAWTEDCTATSTTHGGNCRPATWSRVAKGPPSLLPSHWLQLEILGNHKESLLERKVTSLASPRMAAAAEIRYCDSSTTGSLKTPEVPGHLRPPPQVITK